MCTVEIGFQEAVLSLGPRAFACPLVKVKDQYRWYVWPKGTDMSDAMQLLNNVILRSPRLKRLE